MSAPAVAVTSDGKKFAAAWKDVREGSPRVWWAAGADPKFGSERPIADEPRVERDHPCVAVDDRGAFWCAWEDGTGPSRRIRARILAPRESPREVADSSEGTPAFPVTACGAGLVVVAWETTSKPAGDRVFVRVIQDAPR